MQRHKLTLVPSETGTKLLLMQDEDEVMRAMLPPLSNLVHEAGVMRFLEGLSLWLDTYLCVALCVDAKEVPFCFGVTDPNGVGVRSAHYTVKVRHWRRPVCHHGDARQLTFWATTGETP